MNRNLVLVGRTGNGKSATANSILGRKVFESRTAAAGVTQYCQLVTTRLGNRQTINIIDTPGFFDFSPKSELIGDEIVKCVDKVKDGIHAFILVLSTRHRFSQEEEAVIDNLRMLFGEKVLDYMIVVFTGGDDLKESDKTLEQYLGTDCPPPLEKIIRQTKNKCVLFDNRTTDINEKNAQVQKLITTVDTALLRNGGRPFMDDLIDLQAGVIKVREKAGRDARYAKQLEENMKKFMEEVVSRLEAQAIMLQSQLARADQARMMAERRLEGSQQQLLKMAEESSDMRRRLEAANLAKRQAKLKLEQRKRSGGGDGCSIL